MGVDSSSDIGRTHANALQLTVSAQSIHHALFFIRAGGVVGDDLVGEGVELGQLERFPIWQTRKMGRVCDDSRKHVPALPLTEMS